MKDRKLYHKKYYLSNKEKMLSQVKNSLKSIKQRVIETYGNKCICCGESELDFLCMDHINGNGNKHRRENKSIKKIYYWLARNNFPNDFQILCFNCNFSKHLNKGLCIHQLNNIWTGSLETKAAHS